MRYKRTGLAKGLWHRRLGLAGLDRLLLPVARFALAPIAHSLRIVRTAEVIAIAYLAQPSALAGTLADLAALRLGTVNLVVSVSIIRKKKLLATTALATRELGTHGGVPTGEEEPGAQSTTPPGKRKKTKKEEEF